MAKFKAAPHYSVHHKGGNLKFDHVGLYETYDEGEIAVLNGLCPRYLICVDKGEEQPKKAEPKAEAKPAAKPKATRKTSAK
jgi:hypothetical protein